MLDIKNKTILVTGSTGFIGSNLVKFLLSKGAVVRLFDIEKHKSVLDVKDILEATHGCDYVIHLAAMLGVSKTEQQRMSTLNTNIIGTINVLGACVASKVKKVVFSSSSEVYGEQMKQPIEETTAVNPKSVYAVTKLAGEEYLKAYKQSYNLDYTIVRFFNAYGPQQKNNFVLPKFVNTVLNGEAPTIYGNGSQIRSFCYIDDIVNGIYLALVNEKANSEIFNIGNDIEPISMRDLALKIMKIYGREMPLKKVEFTKSDRNKERDIFVRIPDITKAKTILGYEPKVSLEEGIKKTIEHWEEQV